MIKTGSTGERHKAGFTLQKHILDDVMTDMSKRLKKKAELVLSFKQHVSERQRKITQKKHKATE